MRRTAIAAAWIAGSMIPLAASVVFFFGCCVLPFHHVIHNVVPLCRLATGAVHHHRQQPLPARGKQEPVKRMATDVPRTFPSPASPAPQRHVSPVDALAYRSFVALGALRCDDDVGLHLLVATLLI